MKDKLREGITDLILEPIQDHIEVSLDRRSPRYYAKKLTDKILSLIAPELDAARLWRRVKEIADSRPPCKCPLWDAETAECTSEHAGCIFDDVVDALSKETT
jgi:hypothetical protein